jgi:Spy/CpxP family protein refolding chaperone
MNGTSSTKRAAFWWVFVVFVLGLALGGVGGYALMHHRMTFPEGPHSEGDRRAHIVRRLTRELNLTADQQAQLGQIVDQLLARYKAIHDQTVPQNDAARQQARDAIRAVLTPEQRQKFEAFLLRLDEERKKRHQD